MKAPKSLKIPTELEKPITPEAPKSLKTPTGLKKPTTPEAPKSLKTPTELKKPTTPEAPKTNIDNIPPPPLPKDATYFINGKKVSYDEAKKAMNKGVAEIHRKKVGDNEYEFHIKTE